MDGVRVEDGVWVEGGVGGRGPSGGRGRWTGSRWRTGLVDCLYSTLRDRGPGDTINVVSRTDVVRTRQE